MSPLCHGTTERSKSYLAAMVAQDWYYSEDAYLRELRTHLTGQIAIVSLRLSGDCAGTTTAAGPRTRGS